MKQTAITFFSLLFTCAIMSTSAQDLAMVKSMAILDFESEVVDYGTIEQNSDGTRLFKFINKGNAPLVITSVKTSCGCTVPNYSKEPILPGQEGELEIKYDTKRLGAFTKTITVISNAKETKKVLKITGNVVASN